jgi:hypothetical protein
VLCCLTSLPRLTVRQIQHTCMPTNVHQHRSEIQLSHKSIATDAHQPSDIDMYSAKPPSRATFHLTGMPSPPAALRPLVNRLNRTPTHRERAIKAEPMSPPSRPDNTFGQLAPACHQQPAMQNTATSNSSWTSTEASDNSALSQALVDLLNTPPATNTTPVLDFQGCRVEIHFHIHFTVRPAFPPRYSRSDTLKRKRDGRDVDEMAEGTEILERQVKRIKLSHDSQAGYKIRGNANARKRPERMTAADGVQVRSGLVSEGCHLVREMAIEAGFHYGSFQDHDFCEGLVITNPRHWISLIVYMP